MEPSAPKSANSQLENTLDTRKARQRLEATGPILRDLIIENADNKVIINQLHQLINHILVARNYLEEEDSVEGEL